MDYPFREYVEPVINRPGRIEAAAFCRNLIEGSRYVRNLDEIRGSIAESYQPTKQTISHADESIQTPYSLRCIPQGIGPILESVRGYQVVIEREINSANDNPLVDPIEGRIYHTGNFYGGHVARALDGWKIDLATLGNWLHALMAMVVDDRLNNGLPGNLAPKPRIFSEINEIQL